MKRALIIVDVQNDFIPGGALPTKDGGEVVPVVNDLVAQFDVVVATQDWHPSNHKSFASQHSGKKPGDVIDLNGLQQVLWPDHCVQNSRGAELHRDLRTDRIDKVIRKGTDPEIDSYSGFFDNGRRRATGLEEYLRERAVTDVYVTGLATDYCVLWTARDAQSLGFKTHVIAEACRGVELKAGDIERAFDEMRKSGIDVIAPVKPPIAIDVLNQIDVRAGTIVAVEDVPKSKKLVRLRVDFGDRTRTILAGLKQERPDPSVLVGRQALFVVNLEPRQLAGETSEGMLFDLGYADKITPCLAVPEQPVPNGTRAG